MSKATSMSRSRNQIASAYAPESFFTFEGGMGACIAKAIPSRAHDIGKTTQNQIFERIDEMARGWFDQAITCRIEEENQPTIRAIQCLSVELLNPSNDDYSPLDSSRIAFLHPSHMGYAPAPLTFLCESCKLVKTFDTVDALDKELGILSSVLQCPHPKKISKCDWRQLDLVFVHWSGSWEPARVDQYHWDPKAGAAIRRKQVCTCGCTDFVLERPTSAIGDAFFRCAMCNKPVSPKWLQNDKQTIEWLGADSNDPQRLTEVRMQVAPYRASSVYYVQSDQFIDFKDQDGQNLGLLVPGRENELLDFIGQRYGFSSTYPSHDEMKDNVLQAGRETEWTNYESLQNILKMLKATGNEDGIAAIKEALENKLDDWIKLKIIKKVTEVPAELSAMAFQRKKLFSTRYDPYRLAVEHATLEQNKLTPNTVHGSKRLYVPFDNLDEDLSPKNPLEKKAQESGTRDLMSKLGIEKMGLIREFDLCKFSFGYSRMESGPVLGNKRGMNMPVRLNLFPKVPVDDKLKNPIYVVTQANEAIYVKLDENLVVAWLKELNCPDMFDLSGGLTPGGGLLKAAHPMSRFLEVLPKSDKPSMYLYSYTLLHTYSHLMMRMTAEYSGLDVGSLGEYLFPTDFAFVIYRNGTTMDLGNLSAMWRNSGEVFLRSLLQPKALLCGSGSLCTQRGGSCPDCLMVPETSCVANNKLISRSVLRSIGGRPKFDTRNEFTTAGYLDVVEKRLAKESSTNASEHK